MAYYEPGQYDCIIRGQGFSESKGKKTPFFFLTIQPVKHNGQELEHADYTRDLKLWLTDKTVERVAAQLEQLGWDRGNWSDLERNISFEGKNLRCICSHDIDGENTWERWELPAPASKSQPEPVSGLGKKINSLFAKQLKKSKPAKKPAPVNTASPLVEPGWDDIPF